MPTLDVDLENGKRTELSKIAKTDLDDRKTPAQDDNTLLLNIRRMDEMSDSYKKQGIHLQFPRSIYEPYSSSGLSSSNMESLRHRIKNQVLCNYLQRSEEPDETGSSGQESRPSDAIQQDISSNQNNLPSRTRRKVSTAKSIPKNIDDPNNQDFRKAGILQPPPEQHNNPPNQASRKLFRLDRQQRTVAPASSPEQNLRKSIPQGVVISQLWVLMIFVKGESEDIFEGKWTVITAFPDRWNTDIVPTLLSRIQNAFHPIEVVLEKAKVTEVVKEMLFVCINFIEETFYLGMPVTYSNAFAASIARLVSFIILIPRR